MKKTMAIIIVGMFVIVGCGSAVFGGGDDIVSNRPPKAPVFIDGKSDLEKQSYKYVFYAEDPDGDDVYYDVEWKKAGETKIISCSPDDPTVYWFGPYTSGEELQKIHTFYKYGEYELTIRAKDSHNFIGPSTTITVTYKNSIIQLPILNKLMEKYPEIFHILTKLF